MWVEYWQILFTTSVEGNSKLQTKAIIRGNGEHWTENHLTYRFDLLRPFSLLHLTTVEANRELLESQRKDRLLDSLSFCIPLPPPFLAPPPPTHRISRFVRIDFEKSYLCATRNHLYRCTSIKVINFPLYSKSEGNLNLEKWTDCRKLFSSDKFILIN